MSSPSAPQPWWRSRRAIALAVAMIAVAIAGLLSKGEQAPNGATGKEAGILKVGDQRGGAQALLTAAGELKNLPYKIDWALFPAASPLLEALGAGAIDIGGIGGAPFAFAYASGAEIKAVTAFRVTNDQVGRASAIVVKAGSPLRSVADLKGRKLATIRGSSGQDLALRLLDQAGLKAGDVQWVYLASGEAKAALASGAIDAWSTWGSYVGIAALKDGDRILADGRAFGGSVGFYAASDTAIASKRALLADYIARLARAREWGRRHPREYAAVLARETGIPEDVALFSVQSNLGTAIPIDDGVIAEQQAIFARYHKAGIIPTVPDARKGYDSSFNGVIPADRK